MPRIVADIVDSYVFRKLSGRTQFLLLRRQPDKPMGDTWQSIHGKILGNETALVAAQRAVRERIGVPIEHAYAADLVNHFFDSRSDTIILAPVFAFTIPNRVHIHLNEEYCDFAWCDREEAVSRVLWAGQRQAIRHIDEVIAQGSPEVVFYQVD